MPVAATSNRPQTPPAPDRRWSRILIVTGGLTLVGAVVVGPLWWVYPPVAIGTMLFTALFSCAGVILHDEPGHRATGLLLVLAGQLWALGWSEEWAVGPFPFISGPCSYAALSMAAWAMFRYPDPALVSRLERVFLGLLSVLLVGGILVDNVTIGPQWRAYDPQAVWWFTVRADRALNDAVVGVVHQTQVVMVGLFILLWLVRIRRMRGLDRETVLPMALASPLLAVVAGALPVAELFHAPVLLVNRIYAVQAVVLGLLPLTFLISVVRRRLADNAVLTLIGQVQRRPTPEAVQTALRQALRDASLRVRYWAPDLNSYVDVTGAPEQACAPPAPGAAAGRLVLPVSTAAGGPLALVEADPILGRHPQMLENALAASSLALENAQLQAAVLSRLREVRLIRAQAVQAAVAERRRVERNLHDGAQQRLLALRLVLAAEDSPDLPTEARERLHAVSQELGVVLADLRDLARGIHPAVLSQAGLAAAVEAAARLYPFTVDVDLPAGRFPAVAEETAYQLICAALRRPAPWGVGPETGSGSAPEVGSGSAPEVGSGSAPEVGSGSTPEVGSEVGRPVVAAGAGAARFSGGGQPPVDPAVVPVRVRGHASDGVLTIEVEDEIREPGQLRLGAELPGMLDRVRALGGDIIFSALAQGGGLMVAVIPLP